jgi:hypothetical protein
VSGKRKRKEQSPGDTPAVLAAENLASYQQDLIRLRIEDQEMRKIELALKERKVLALESISRPLANKYGG